MLIAPYFARGLVLIRVSSYAGEITTSVFGTMNNLPPFRRRYLAMLAERTAQHQSRVWLPNTGGQAQHLDNL